MSARGAYIPELTLRAYCSVASACVPSRGGCMCRDVHPCTRQRIHAPHTDGGAISVGPLLAVRGANPPSCRPGMSERGSGAAGARYCSRVTGQGRAVPVRRAPRVGPGATSERGQQGRGQAGGARDEGRGPCQLRHLPLGSRPPATLPLPTPRGSQGVAGRGPGRGTDVGVRGRARSEPSHRGRVEVPVPREGTGTDQDQSGART